MVAAVAAVALATFTAPAQATGSKTGTSSLTGRTTVVTGPGIAGVLLRNGILPVVTWPGTPGITHGAGGLAVTASFPVTGGSVALNPPSGQVLHRGGIKFVNLRNGTSLEVGRFTIDLNTGQLTGAVNRTSTRVAVFDLDLSAASITVEGRVVRVSNVGLKLTAGAAGALNQTLGVSIFSAGLAFGTARTRLVLPAA